MIIASHISIIYLLKALTASVSFIVILKYGHRLSSYYKTHIRPRVTGQLSQTIPRLRGKFIVGRMPYLFKEDGPLHNMSEAVALAEAKGKDACYFWAGPKLVVVTTDANKVKEFLRKATPAMTRHHAFKAIDTVLGTNIFSADLEQWQIRRTASIDVFSGKAIKTDYSSPIASLVTQYVNKLQKETLTDLSSWSLELVMDITLATIFAVPIEKLSRVEQEKKRLLELLFTLFHFRKIIVFDMPTLIAKTICRRDYFNPRELQAEFYEVINRVRQKIPEMDHGDSLFNRHFGPALGSENLTGDMLLLLFAGPDSTVSTLSSILCLLDKDPIVTEQLIAEVKDNIENERYLNAEKTLLARIIKEALRLYPPFIFLTRGITEPMQFQDMKVPKNSLLFMPILHLQRLERIWGEDALEFKPDRWLNTTPEQIANYFPFGYGAQNCIAKGFAVHVIKEVMIKMLSHMGMPSLASNAISIESRRKNICS